MGMLLVGILVVGGIVGLFVVPWIGAAVLVAAVVLGVIVLGASAARGAEGGNDGPAEAPHLPGPGNPESGAD